MGLARKSPGLLFDIIVLDVVHDEQLYLVHHALPLLNHHQHQGDSQTLLYQVVLQPLERTCVCS